MVSNNILAPRTPGIREQPSGIPGAPLASEPQATSETAAPPIAQLERISLHFRQGMRALDQFSMQVHQGECLGLLGPNGAGKTTLLRLLAGLLVPNSGQIRLFGQLAPARSIALRRRIGYVAQRGGIDLYLTGRENTFLLGHLYGLHGAALAHRTDELLALVGLTEHAARRAASYSGGMQRRLALASSLVHEPDLLLLDEPTAGLDAPGKAAFWDYLRHLQERGLTMILASHDTQELERYCQRVILMHQGQALAAGTPATLTGHIRGDLLTLELSDASHLSKALSILQNLAGFSSVTPAGGQVTQSNQHALTLEVKDGPATLPKIAHLLEEAQIQVQRITLSRPTLEDVFLRITGMPLASSQARDNGAELIQSGATAGSQSIRRLSPFRRHLARRHAPDGGQP
jgi:ABC-2 type transport system ATP-binding protein